MCKSRSHHIWKNHYSITRYYSVNYQCNKFLKLLLKLALRMNYDVKSLTLHETKRCGRNSKRKMLCIPSNRRKAGTFLFVGLVTYGKTCRGCAQGRFLTYLSTYKLHVTLSILLSKFPIFILTFPKYHILSFMKIQHEISIRNS